MKKRVMTIVLLSVCACANVSRGAPRDDALSGTWRGVVRKGLLESVVLMEFSRAGSGYRGKFWGAAPVGAPVPLAGIELGHSVRFEVPRVGDADTFAYYFEAKYKFTPQLFGALRWNQQLFDSVDAAGGGKLRWGQDLGRLDISAGYRFTPHTQLKLQYSYQQQTTGPRDTNHLLAAQFTVRF